MKHININEFDYPLPDERIAKFPLERRDSSKLLIYRNGSITERHFADIGNELSEGTLFVFNNTKVVRARLVMHKPSGARIEVFCLEPHNPADYERAFVATGSCEWSCIIGNLKKWKEGAIEIRFAIDDAEEYVLQAHIVERGEREHIVRFDWSAPLTFGQLLEHLGRIPIPPYLNRESEEIDNTRYQTVYSQIEGSVAAPTAGLHFTTELIESLENRGFEFGEVTLHVGAGTFLPVKSEDAVQHRMHTEHFSVTEQLLLKLQSHIGKTVSVGTTSVRTLESLAALAWRIKQHGSPATEQVIGQWELYDIPSEFGAAEIISTLLDYMRSHNVESIKAATQIMITPLGYRFRIVNRIVTNFHQPKSTLLLLVSAYVGDDWHRIYEYALANDFRFLSYGDSSLLIVDDEK